MVQVQLCDHFHHYDLWLFIITPNLSFFGHGHKSVLIIILIIIILCGVISIYTIIIRLLMSGVIPKAYQFGS